MAKENSHTPMGMYTKVNINLGRKTDTEHLVMPMEKYVKVFSKTENTGQMHHSILIRKIFLWKLPPKKRFTKKKIPRKKTKSMNSQIQKNKSVFLGCGHGLCLKTVDKNTIDDRETNKYK